MVQAHTVGTACKFLECLNIHQQHLWHELLPNVQSTNLQSKCAMPNTRWFFLNLTQRFSKCGTPDHQQQLVFQRSFLIILMHLKLENHWSEDRNVKTVIGNNLNTFASFGWDEPRYKVKVKWQCFTIFFLFFFFQIDCLFFKGGDQEINSNQNDKCKYQWMSQQPRIHTL